MRPTLFYIPHEFLGIPVLGFGWVLAAIVAFAIAVLATSRKKQSVAKVLEEPDRALLPWHLLTRNIRPIAKGIYLGRNTHGLRGLARAFSVKLERGEKP